MANPRSEATLAETVTRITDDLRDKGTTRVHIEQEADGDIDLAHRMLYGVALALDVSIEVKNYRMAVAAKVVETEPDDE